MDTNDWWEKAGTVIAGIIIGFGALKTHLRKRRSKPEPDLPPAPTNGNGKMADAFLAMSDATNKTLMDLLHQERHEHAATSRELSDCRSAYNELYKKCASMEGRIEALEKEIRMLKGEE